MHAARAAPPLQQPLCSGCEQQSAPAVTAERADGGSQPKPKKGDAESALDADAAGGGGSRHGAWCYVVFCLELRVWEGPWLLRKWTSLEHCVGSVCSRHGVMIILMSWGDSECAGE